MAQRGFRPHIHDARPLRPEDFSPLHRLFNRQANALAVPGIGRQIDHPHDGRLGIKPERLPVNGKLPHAGGESVAVGLGQLGQPFEREHKLMQSDHSAPLVIQGGAMFSMQKWTGGNGRFPGLSRAGPHGPCARDGAPAENRTRDPLLRRQYLTQHLPRRIPRLPRSVNPCGAVRPAAAGKCWYDGGMMESTIPVRPQSQLLGKFHQPMRLIPRWLWPLALSS